MTSPRRRFSAAEILLVLGTFLFTWHLASPSATTMTPSRAFCSDLSKGYSPFQILNEFVQNGDYTPREAANNAYGYARISCPTQLRTNESLRYYLSGWSIDPDA